MAEAQLRDQSQQQLLQQGYKSQNSRTNCPNDCSNYRGSEETGSAAAEDGWPVDVRSDWCWQWLDVLPNLIPLENRKFSHDVCLNRTSAEQRKRKKCAEGWVSSNVARLRPRRSEWQLWRSDLKWKDEVMYNGVEITADQTLMRSLEEALTVLLLHHENKEAFSLVNKNSR